MLIIFKKKFPYFIGSQGKVIIAVTVGGAVAAVTAICAVIWVKRRYLAKQKDQANVYQMTQFNRK